MKDDVSTVRLVEPDPPVREFRGELSLWDLARLLWRRKVLILCIAVGFAAAAVSIAELMPKRYEAHVLIAPVARDARDGGLSSSLGQLAGVAALAGLTGIGGGSKAEALATLQSEVLTEKYIREQNLLPILYAKKWDARAHAWLVGNPKDVPTVWRANEYFAKEIRSVSEDKKTSLVIMSITWTDPVLAARWANDLVDLTNGYMRQLAIEQAEANIAYLTAKAEKTTAVEMKATIYTLMQSELKSAMMAEGSQQFALKVIDPAVPPERHSSPKPLLWALAGFVSGFFLSAGYVFFRAGWAARS
jgi:uncharacterized protein involved in exopolysaccharide biosynthesis